MTSPTAPAKKWRFTTLGEDTMITAAGLVAAGVFTAGVAAAFGPLGIGLALGYSLVKTGPTFAGMLLPPVRNIALRSLKKSRDCQLAEEDSPIARIVAEQSQRLGWKNPPPVFIVNEKIVAKQLPFYMRWVMNDQETRNEIMPKIFAAVPGIHFVITTREGLAAMSEEQLAFIAAHELSHLKKDALSMPLFVQALKKRMTEALTGVVLGGCALGLAGVSLPLFTGGALLATGALIASTVVAGVINNIGVRAYERRADRNALYINQTVQNEENATQSFRNARIALERLHDQLLPYAKKNSMLSEIFKTHPSQKRRDEALKKSFAKVLAHAAPDASAQVTIRAIDSEARTGAATWWLPQGR